MCSAEVQDLPSDSDVDVIRMSVQEANSNTDVDVAAKTKQKNEKGKSKQQGGDKSHEDRFKCSFFEQIFKTKQNLKKHLLRKHEGNSIGHLETGKTLCLECGKKFIELSI